MSAESNGTSWRITLPCTRAEAEAIDSASDLAIDAVLGLIHVMENLTDPSKLGSGIAVAFVSTIYGVGLANLLFLPVANKLKAIVSRRVLQYEITAAVLYDIATGDHTRIIEERVASLLHEH